MLLSADESQRPDSGRRQRCDNGLTHIHTFTLSSAAVKIKYNYNNKPVIGSDAQLAGITTGMTSSNEARWPNNEGKAADACTSYWKLTLRSAKVWHAL